MSALKTKMAGDNGNGLVSYSNNNEYWGVYAIVYKFIKRIKEKSGGTSIGSRSTMAPAGGGGKRRSLPFWLSIANIWHDEDDDDERTRVMALFLPPYP